MNDLKFQSQGWEDFLYWQQQDPKTLKRIIKLLRDLDRNGYNGIGKPEPLQGALSGWWSVRIDSINRLVFKIENGELIVYSCRGHYGDT